MNHCPNCGKEISEFAVECPHCRFRIDESALKQQKPSYDKAHAADKKQIISNIPLWQQLISAVIFAVMGVAAIIIARIFETRIFDMNLGDNAVAVIKSAIGHREIAVMAIVFIAITVGAVIVLPFICQVTKQAEISFGIVFIILFVLAGTLFDIFFLSPQDYIMREDLMASAVELSKGLPFYCAIILSSYVCESLYGVLKWGKMAGIVNAFIVFVVTLMLLIVKAKILVDLGFGIAVIYSIPSAFITFVITLLLLFVENIIYTKMNKRKAKEDV